MSLRDAIVSLRPTQWVKNLFLFAALIFSQNLAVLSKSLRVCWGFVLFCALASSTYLINDLFDLQKDQKHPIKSRRPLASGRLSRSQAVLIAVFLGAISLGFSFKLHTQFGMLALAYFLMNFAYSAFLKHVIILDVMLLAFGFVLRAVAGAVVIEVEISSWLLICTILIALFLALSKRRHELVIMAEGSQDHRKVLGEYSPYFLDQMIGVVTASTLMSYMLYTLSPEVIRKLETANLKFTIPFVLYGIFRYLYLVHQQSKGGSPTKVLLTDKPLMLNILLWFVAIWVILYL
ncbi:MAG: phosphoribose diphosphate--decaprenyl-phosphate phosphoribosyltransferase [candidate division Zixibacteria bacterium SM23_81]|nr:MAG: phosphoribose diphosphate--decaprenyl-phosphate phosphoribosyltransferase [candidate division Zixibacteria bacterium SM23_81]